MRRAFGVVTTFGLDGRRVVMAGYALEEVGAGEGLRLHQRVPAVYLDLNGVDAATVLTLGNLERPARIFPPPCQNFAKLSATVSIQAVAVRRRRFRCNQMFRGTATGIWFGRRTVD